VSPQLLANFLQQNVPEWPHFVARTLYPAGDPLNPLVSFFPGDVSTQMMDGMRDKIVSDLQYWVLVSEEAVAPGVYRVKRNDTQKQPVPPMRVKRERMTASKKAPLTSSKKK